MRTRFCKSLSARATWQSKCRRHSGARLAAWGSSLLGECNGAGAALDAPACARRAGEMSLDVVTVWSASWGFAPGRVFLGASAPDGVEPARAVGGNRAH